MSYVVASINRHQIVCISILLYGNYYMRVADLFVRGSWMLFSLFICGDTTLIWDFLGTDVCVPWLITKMIFHQLTRISLSRGGSSWMKDTDVLSAVESQGTDWYVSKVLHLCLLMKVNRVWWSSPSWFSLQNEAVRMYTTGASYVRCDLQWETSRKV